MHFKRNKTKEASMLEATKYNKIFINTESHRVNGMDFIC